MLVNSSKTTLGTRGKLAPKIKNKIKTSVRPEMSEANERPIAIIKAIWSEYLLQKYVTILKNIFKKPGRIATYFYGKYSNQIALMSLTLRNSKIKILVSGLPNFFISG